MYEIRDCFLYRDVSARAFSLRQRQEKSKEKKMENPGIGLLGVGFFGGAVGALLGMNLFHHKTRHWYFWIVNIFSLALHAALFCYLFI